MEAVEIQLSILRKVGTKILFVLVKIETAIKNSQTRINCSKLNAHLCYLHLLEVSHCNCGFDYEDNNQYLLHFLYMY